MSGELPTDLTIRGFRPGDEAAVRRFFGQMGGETRAFLTATTGTRTSRSAISRVRRATANFTWRSPAGR